jgi:DNA polymerase (family 10)
MKNKDIASLFQKMADLLEFKNENVFKINAYRKSARVLNDLTADVDELVRTGDLQNMPGIGKGMAEKIQEYLATGHIAKYEEMKQGIGDELIALLGVPSLGPKTLAMLHREMKINSLDDLKKAVHDERMAALPGMGKKKIENITRGIELYAMSRERMPLGDALVIAREAIAQLKQATGVKEIEAAGSLRRGKETIGDIDILAAGAKKQGIIDAFVHLPMAHAILARGETKGSIVTGTGIQLDLRVVEKHEFGAALQYFTGSKSHNVRLREIARRGGLKINEYGIFSGERKVAGESEEEMYATLKMNWIPPELREDRGELEAALQHTLPPLIRRTDMHGDLHVHSHYSDGAHSIAEIADAVKKMGYQYIAVTDHSPSLTIARGLSAARLREKIAEVQKINHSLSGTRLLCGAEVDIKNDGSLDYPDDLLTRLDLVIAAIHSGFKQTREQITGRIIKAMHNSFVHIIAHPTGRLLGEREPYNVDMSAVIEEAARTGTALEINAYKDRLDLDDVTAMEAGKKGAMLALGTDSHHIEQLWMMELGIMVARRGWLERRHLLNAMTAEELLAWTNAKRARVQK